ncbi:MAG: DNA-processing protein DprA [Gemmatimonadota bacterium]|nr:DNA-processing protein DprA [Gemmatimonadota bacterium]
MNAGLVIRALQPGCSEYPAALAGIAEAPDPLYVIGDSSCLSDAPQGTVAIVGTRDASEYGVRVAQALGRAFAEAGAVVVSGLARGIDSAAHRGALEGGGRTVAVLGTGPDVPYPAGNRRLHGQIAKDGLVISENPPGRHAYKGCFPRRNRLIAALSRLTIVVEAPHKSGALNTATQALELGRVVAAVPGHLGQPRCEGSNTLLRDGAHVLASVDDALALLGVSRKRTVAYVSGGADADVWDLIGSGCRTVDRIAEDSGREIGEVAAAVSRLEITGLVAVGSDGTIHPTLAVDGSGDR